jgi:hypothetical protein
MKAKNSQHANSLQDQMDRTLFKIEEACSVLSQENSIYSTDFEEALNEFFSRLETDDEKKACRKWCSDNGFDVA